jgi:hydrogenase expression/formation protein HypE
LNDVAMAARGRSISPPVSFWRKAFRSPIWSGSSFRWREQRRSAGVPIVTGDTKVVEKGKGDGVFITTTGLGVVPDGVHVSAENANPGQAILLSGPIGDHGVAILSKRENLEFETEIRSDSAALHGLSPI